MKKEYTKPITNQVVINVEYFCDWCKKQYHDTAGTFEHERGNMCSGWGDYTKRFIELCPDCTDKLWKVIEDLGITVQSEDISY